MHQHDKGSDGLFPMANIRRLEMCPDVKHMAKEFDPDNLTAAEVLKIITLALANTKGADGLARMKAEVVMNEQYHRGATFGREQGERRGYENGYREGLEDGKREALDKLASEEADRATLKAAALARRSA
jgi:flagellar biosynthesis/type III secretory pathway protein FliH